MKRFRKADVQFHSEGCRQGHPAVNIKVKNPYIWDHFDNVQSEFKCSSDTAQKALEYSVQMACGQFWEDVQQYADEVFTQNVKVWQEGRSGGWLVVEGLPAWDYWNAIDLTNWYRFQKHVKEAVKFYTSWEYIKENIEGNNFWLTE